LTHHAPDRSAPRRALDQAGVLAAALAGGGALAFAGVPAGWLSGAMIAVAALAAIGRAAPLAVGLRQLAILLAGIGMGSGLTPTTLHTLTRYPASLALMIGAIAAMTAASYFALVGARGFSRQTAFYSAIPGALSYVFIVAQPSGADMARLAVIQVFRIFVLMALVPIVASRVGVLAPTSYAVDPMATSVALVAVAGAIGVALQWLGLASGSLYAAIALSALAHGLGWAPGRLAPPIQIGAQTLIGAWIGTRFIGFDWGLLHRTLIAAATSFLAAFAAAAGFAYLASLAVGAPFPEALVAFAPGGLEAMTMMAFALGLDPLFVGAHHLARFVVISAALPFLAAWLARRARSAGSAWP
jgi:membrane AbrB-like protein